MNKEWENKKISRVYCNKVGDQYLVMFSENGDWERIKKHEFIPCDAIYMTPQTEDIIRQLFPDAEEWEIKNMNRNCWQCSWCSKCWLCFGCTDCVNCTDCSYCYFCTETECSKGCRECLNCNECMECMRSKTLDSCLLCVGQENLKKEINIK